VMNMYFNVAEREFRSFKPTLMIRKHISEELMTNEKLTSFWMNITTGGNLDKQQTFL